MPRKASDKSAKVNFAARLHKLREDRGWSQAVLADKAGITQAMLSYLESGRKEPGWQTVQLLAAALKIKTDVFR